MKIIVLVFLLTTLQLNGFVKAYCLDKEYEGTSTIAFLMYDPLLEHSYILDLKLNVMDFKNSPQPFKLNLLNIINKVSSEKYISIKHFRWGFIGGEFKLDYPTLLGYVGAFSGNGEPGEKTLRELQWSVQTIKDFFRYNKYEKAGKYSISIVRDPNLAGHYLKGWQGNIKGLSKHMLEGKVGDYNNNTLTVWNIFNGIEEPENNDAESYGKYLQSIKKTKMGYIEVTEVGELKFNSFENT